jgi:hypothetical protein
MPVCQINSFFFLSAPNLWRFAVLHDHLSISLLLPAPEPYLARRAEHRLSMVSIIFFRSRSPTQIGQYFYRWHNIVFLRPGINCVSKINKHCKEICVELDSLRPSRNFITTYLGIWSLGQCLHRLSILHHYYHHERASDCNFRASSSNHDDDKLAEDSRAVKVGHDNKLILK